MDLMNNGIIMFNKNKKCTVRALVALYTIRKYYNGPITFFIETSPEGFNDSVRYFGCDVVELEENTKLKTLIRKTQIFANTPYENTLWLDSDTILVGKIDEMFGYLENYDVAIPHFSNWYSDGHIIKRRINNFKEHVSDKIFNIALEHKPAVNTGVVAYRRDSQFLRDWIDLTIKTNGLCFISDEVAFQVLYPSYQGIYIAPMKFNVSARFGNDVEDKRIVHFHGSKHSIPQFPLCAHHWIPIFEEMRKGNIADINYFVDNYADRRLRKFLKGERVWGQEEQAEDDNIINGDSINSIKIPNINNSNKDVTIVTAIDNLYVDILRETFANWRKYKNIDDYPVMVFVHGISIKDPRLDFLKLPNVIIIPWSMDNVESHREEMLSAFVFGTAENVKTDYWMKLDADSYATDNRPLIDDSMKQFDFCGHRWGYSRPDHIRKLDEWAKGHWKKKLKNSKPMIEEGRVEGNRFYHNRKRTISFAQLHKTRFTKFCVKLLKERRLPAPTQDTYMFYICSRFDPEHIGIKNFKKNYGFTQGKGKWKVEYMRRKLQEVDEAFNKNIQSVKETIENNIIDSEENEETYDVSPIAVEMIPTVNKSQESEKKSITHNPFIIPEGKDVIIEIVELNELPKH